MKLLSLIIAHLGIAVVGSIITIGVVKDDLDRANDYCSVSFLPGSDYTPAGEFGVWSVGGVVYGYSLEEDSEIVRSADCLPEVRETESLRDAVVQKMSSVSDNLRVH